MSGDAVKSLTKQDWKVIRKRYEKGNRITDIAKDYKLKYQTIQRRARVENWGNKHLPKTIKEAITNRAVEINNIKREFKENMQQTDKPPMDINDMDDKAIVGYEELSSETKKKIKQEITKEVLYEIADVSRMQYIIKKQCANSLSIYNELLLGIREKLDCNQMNELQAATILSKMGFTLNTLRDIAEMGNSNKINNNIQINNDQQRENVTINIQPVA